MALMPILLFVCVVVIATIAILTLRLLLQQELLGKNVRFGGEIGGAIGSSINAVVIVALNILYKKMAIMLNNWENHRTETEYKDRLTIKVFLFQFVNSYLALYYLAFVKGGREGSGIDLWGSGVCLPSTSFMKSPTLKILSHSFLLSLLSVHDQCESATDSVFGCMPEVTVQLIILMLVQAIILQAQEILGTFFEYSICDIHIITCDIWMLLTEMILF